MEGRHKAFDRNAPTRFCHVFVGRKRITPDKRTAFTDGLAFQSQGVLSQALSVFGPASLLERPDHLSARLNGGSSCGAAKLETGAQTAGDPKVATPSR